MRFHGHHAMNRYPLWKNATVLIAMVLGLLYTLPNFLR
jgi:preprotein translocase subunit SecD